MITLTDIQNALVYVYDLGGPVVAVLLAVSVFTTALILYKTWQYSVAGVGRHKALSRGVDALDEGRTEQAVGHLRKSRSYLRPVIEMAMTHGAQDALIRERADAEAEVRFAKLERGLNLLDTIAQLAPLLGLFGTVLGMIEAFQKLQNAGDSVDPSLLAGGIWVALLTTAAGLAVAMPTSLILSWFEARMRAERVFANTALRRVCAPAGAAEQAQRAAVYDISAEAAVHGA